MQNVSLCVLYKEITPECIQQLTRLSEALEWTLGKPDTYNKFIEFKSVPSYVVSWAGTADLCLR